jgi:hypothetical protein
MVAGASLLLIGAYLSAKAAENAYGNGINGDDVGGVEAMWAAILYFLPNALLFGLASLCMWRRWAARWLVQALAILWLILPIVALIYFFETAGP